MCTARVNSTMPHKISKKMRILFYIVCLSISLLLQLVGFVIPGWGYLKGDALTFHLGLWYRVTCKKDGCQTGPMATGKDNDMLEYQIETSMSLATCITAIVSLFIYVRNVKNNKMITALIIGMLASMLSGVLALLASGKMGNKYQHLHEEQMEKHGKSVYKSPYSLFLTGTGGLVECLVFLALLVEIHVILKKSLPGNSAIDKNSTRSEQPVVAAVTTEVYSAGPPNERPSQNVTTYTRTPASTDEYVTLPRTYQTPGNTKGMYEYICARPKIKVKSSPNIAVDQGSRADPAANTTASKDDHAEPVYGNIVLANGQHIVINDIYSM